MSKFSKRSQQVDQSCAQIMIKMVIDKLRSGSEFIFVIYIFVI